MSERSWNDAIDSVAKRFELAASLDLDTRWNPVGNRALAGLLRTMAHKLDIAVAKQLADPPTQTYNIEDSDDAEPT